MQQKPVILGLVNCWIGLISRFFPIRVLESAFLEEIHRIFGVSGIQIILYLIGIGLEQLSKKWDTLYELINVPCSIYTTYDMAV